MFVFSSSKTHLHLSKKTKVKRKGHFEIKNQFKKNVFFNMSNQWTFIFMLGTFSYNFPTILFLFS